MSRRVRFMDQLMAEPIRLPGCPACIVTRADCWDFLVRRCGYDRHARGFGSAHWLAFGRDGRDPLPVDTPLTDLSDPWAVALLNTIARDSGEVQS